jgi:hypothetical protein
MFFYDTNGKRLGSDDLQPIPLYEGMTITIHGYDDTFKVVEWNYHHGHPDEEGGLRIILEKA